MRIAILTTDNRENFKNYGKVIPEFGTAPEALLQGFTHLPDVEVHVVSCTQQPLSSPEKLASNIWFHSLHVPKIGWGRTLFQGCIRAVRRKLREIGPDIVHGQGTERDCAISAVFSGFPNVLTIHGNMAEIARLFKSPFGSYQWVAARLEDFTLPRSAGVFCNSAYTESLVTARAKRTWRVPNALREKFFDKKQTALTTRRCVLLNVGVITRRKRQVELLDVVEELRNRGLDFEFRFIGLLNRSDPYAAAFCKRIEPLQAAGYAKHLDEMSTDKLIEEFDAADALVHFPSEEAFGLVVAEAMARNLRFFGAKIGGIPEIAAGVPDAELHGADDWKGLTDALADWISGKRPRSGNASSLMRERYHPLVIARQHLEIYREVISGS